MIRFFFILFLLPLTSIAQDLQKVKVQKVTDMTSITHNTIKVHVVDSSVYSMTFIDSLQVDSTYIIKIDWGGWNNEVKYKFKITRTGNGYIASSQKTAKIKGVWSGHTYPNTKLTTYQIDSLRMFEKRLFILLKKVDNCQDSQTSFNLFVSGRTKSFVDDMCIFNDPGHELEKLLFSAPNRQVGKNAGRRNMFVNFWFFVLAFVPADGTQSAKIYNLYYN